MLVVGAGPAGADLSRQLAACGVDVLLVERLPDLRRAAFSSAALPLAALDAFGLPQQVVAARWRGWELHGPGPGRRLWQGAGIQGVVLDFAALRQWLVGEAEAWGARVLLGQRALHCREVADGRVTSLRGLDGVVREVHSLWVVDATGQERALLGDPPAGRRVGDRLVSGVGVEWLVELPVESWRRWADRLSFCLGSDWVAQGYGWVFPMASPQIKVGVCRLLDPRHRQPPLGDVLQGMLERLLEPSERRLMVVHDRHGGLIRSTIARREPHIRGHLVGLGDAVSTANLLGGEGIRHALRSSRVLAPLLIQELQGPTPRRGDRQGPLPIPSPRERGISAHLGWLAARTPVSSSPGLRAYPSRLRRALGWRWSLSGRLARRTWLGLREEEADRRLDRLLASLEDQPAQALSDLLFDYRFERYGARALPYLLGWR